MEPQKYDGFVLFANEDIDFATELIKTLEDQYNMKLCVRERDLVAGGLEVDMIIKLITERCNRLIAILSNAFLQSAANRFFVSFAQSIGIGTKELFVYISISFTHVCNYHDDVIIF